MKDFLKWVFYESPVWVREIATFVMLSGIFLFFGSLVWAALSGYWIVPAMLPLLGVWVILHTYQKSKKEKKDETI
jgi:uncharacterized membrane protein YgdD (TMEM256/DUF423 family)